MAVKGSATVTLTQYRDIQSVTRYYKLRPAGSSAPLKPETKPPSSDWTDSEPTCDISKELYFCDLTIFSNGQWEYSKVSKSSSYEAAKEAYNRANAAKDSIDNLEIGGRNLIKKDELIFNACQATFDSTEKIDVTNISNTATSGIIFGDFPAGTYTLNYSLLTTLKLRIISSTSFDENCIENPYYASILGGTGYYREMWLPFTFTLVETTRLGIVLQSSSGYTNDTVSSLKLEIGNKATDWTPAPEDVDAGIANAQTSADSAASAAANAQTTADTAKTNAATAQSTADTAKANAATAQSTADTAKANAATAQSTADTAKANAAAAQMAANNAQTSADNAQTGVDSLNDSVFGVQTFNYILDGVTIPAHKREDGTYYYILNDEEVDVAESALVHDSDGDLVSYQEGGIDESLNDISNSIDAIDKKVNGFDARENAIYKEIQDNSLIARKNARVTENSLIITNDTTGDATNLLNYLQLNSTSIVIYGNGKDIVTIAKTKDDSGFMEMAGTSLLIAQESRLSTIRLRSADKIGKLAFVAGSDGHVSLREVLN